MQIALSLPRDVLAEKFPLTFIVIVALDRSLALSLALGSG